MRPVFCLKNSFDSPTWRIIGFCSDRQWQPFQLFEKPFMKKMISTGMAIFPALVMTVLWLTATGCQTSQPKHLPSPPHSELGQMCITTRPGLIAVDSGSAMLLCGRLIFSSLRWSTRWGT